MTAENQRDVQREFSYGGVVLRRGANDKPEVLAITPRGKRAFALPKGGAEPGETPEQTALREVVEETGVAASVRANLGAVEYWYTRDSKRIFKSVHFFLCDFVSGDTTKYDPNEVDQVHWLPLDVALRDLTYSGERDIIQRNLSKLPSYL